MRRLLPVVGLVATAGIALVLAGGSRPERDTREARVERIAEQLRCPTCQGLSVADSPSSTARAIRDDITRRVAGGETDAQVKAAYVDRYGEWILLRPRSAGIGALLWAVPSALIIAGGAALVVAVRRWQRVPPLSATPADHELVRRALAERAADPEPDPES